APREQLPEVVATWLARPADRDRIAAQGRRFFREEYTFERALRQLLPSIDARLAPPGASAAAEGHVSPPGGARRETSARSRDGARRCAGIFLWAVGPARNRVQRARAPGRSHAACRRARDPRAAAHHQGFRETRSNRGRPPCRIVTIGAECAAVSSSCRSAR